MYSRDRKPFGKPWEEWVVFWWKWCYSISTDENAVSDTTGKYCYKNQKDPDVWFLSGTFGGKVERRCTLPSGRAILFPIINDLISYAEYKHLKSEQDLSAYAKDDLDHSTVYRVWVDDLELQNLQNYRVRSKAFSIVIPEGSRWTNTIAVTDGYWVFLKPLSSGEDHTIHFIGEKLMYDEIYGSRITKVPKFRVEVKYNLTVARSKM